MSLTELWATSQKQIREKRVQQIIGFAGDGKLRDAGEASLEFRALLGQVDQSVLARYAEECLAEKFDDGGLALQDVVNQVGRRLGFTVTDGRYRGTTQNVGYDGLWISPFGNQIVVEVKTTDAYRIGLDTLAKYRTHLVSEGAIDASKSSILIIVGRQDTGELEAQIRGSRHAWDIRLISVDALMRLLSVRVEVDNPTVERQISDLLVPREYTRVDGIIDLVFATATEVGADTLGLIPETIPAKKAGSSEKAEPVNFHEACVAIVSKALKKEFIRLSRVMFTSADQSTLLFCAVSKQYGTEAKHGYWYAFHPHQKEKLEKSSHSFVAFGCGRPEAVVLIPFATFEQWLPGMNMTITDGREYWHVHIHSDGQKYILHRKKAEKRIDLTPFLLASS